MACRMWHDRDRLPQSGRINAVMAVGDLGEEKGEMNGRERKQRSPPNETKFMLLVCEISLTLVLELSLKKSGSSLWI